MRIRRMHLEEGWYPQSQSTALKTLETYRAACSSKTRDHYSDCIGAVVPHAGWEYSGLVAYSGLSTLQSADIVILVGGHLPPKAKPFYWDYDACQTPLGEIPINRHLLTLLREEVDLQPDPYIDNTVEVLLPFIKFLQPEASIISLRIPPSNLAIRIGEFLAFLTQKHENDLGRTVIVGSTDLTHYGPNYDFSPAGSGSSAINWAHENDRSFVSRLLAFDGKGALDHANEMKSACSAGAAVTALSFAAKRGSRQASLVEHTDSNKNHTSDSFVGYGSIVFE